MGKNVIINLHLDQKRPRYQGTKAHNAEYDGEAIEQEIVRLKSLLKPIVEDKPVQKEEKKSFWNKLLQG